MLGKTNAIIGSGKKDSNIFSTNNLQLTRCTLSNVSGNSFTLVPDNYSDYFAIYEIPTSGNLGKIVTFSCELEMTENSSTVVEIRGGESLSTSMYVYSSLYKFEEEEADIPLDSNKFTLSWQTLIADDYIDIHIYQPDYPSAVTISNMSVTISEAQADLSPSASASYIASASDILANKLAYLPAGRTVGTMVNRGAVNKSFTPTTYEQTYTIPDGAHNGLGKVTCEAVPTQSKSVTPSSSQQIVKPDSGKYLSQVTVNAVPNTYKGYTAAGVQSIKLKVNASTSGYTGVVDGGTSAYKTVVVSHNNMSNCTLQASNDGTNWINVVTTNNSGDSSNNSSEYGIVTNIYTNQQARYWRLYCTKYNNGNHASATVAVAKSS